MDINTTKLELMQMLLQTEKESILKNLLEVFEKEETDWWNELSKKEQKNIESSIKSLDEGKVISNSEVQERIANYVKSKTNN